MRLAAAARIARRELRGGVKGFRVLLACLAIGVASVAAVGSVRTSIEQGMAREGASLLGGDAEIEFTYRFADEAETEWMLAAAETVSEVVEFRSMAATDADGEAVRGLTQLKAVDGEYPLYGAVELRPPVSLEEALSTRDGFPGAVMHPTLAERLGMVPGDTFSLGTKEFRLSATLEREPDSATAGIGLGPRTIVRSEDLEGTGLITPGSLFSTKYRMVLPESADLGALKSEAEDLFRDSGLRWLDSRNASPGVSEFVARVGAFLVLVGLAGLAVGGIGVSAAVKSYLESKTEVIATLKSLGAERGTIFAAYLLQVGAMIAIGIALGLLIGGILPVAVAPLIEPVLPLPADFGVHARPLAEAALYGALTGSVFALWSLSRTDNISAAALFRDMAESNRSAPSLVLLIAIAALAAALVACAAALSGIPRLTLWAAGGIAGTLAVLAAASYAVRWAAKRMARTGLMRGLTTARLALGSIGGPASEATSVVLSLGLGLSVLAAIGQIASNLNNAIAEDLPQNAPSFFFIDIQSDQLARFQELADGIEGVTEVESAPMLRGIITRINGVPAAEAAGEHWTLQGDRGVTYSVLPPEGATITEGEWWPEGYSGPPQVSFADEEARELGLAIGDKLTINILGRDIEAGVSSFRVVDFRNAGIGFILSLNPGALAGAPHTHIATVYADGDAEQEIFRSATSAFPNVTAISVKEGIERVAGVLSSLASAITYASSATLLTGFVVLIGAAAAGQRARVFESAVLKAVGATRARILAGLAARSAILGAASGLVAILAGGVAGWAVMTFVMESSFAFEPVSAVSIVFGGATASLVAGLVFAMGPLNASPSRVLRAKE